MLNLKEEPKDNKFLLRTKRGVLKNFKITSYKQLDEAVLLSAYLYVLGRSDEAIRLLESFVRSVEYNPERQDQWGSVGQGVLLLAYIYRENGNEGEQQQLVSCIERNDIMSDRASRATYFAEDLADHQEIIARCPEETHKYRCQILAQQILTFVYYFEMFPTFKKDVHASEKDVIARIINETKQLLAKEVAS